MLAHVSLGVKTSEICVVGDRLMTDIVFGNLNGMLAIHTRPFSTEVRKFSFDLNSLQRRHIQPISRTLSVILECMVF